MFTVAQSFKRGHRLSASSYRPFLGARHKKSRPGNARQRTGQGDCRRRSASHANALHASQRAGLPLRTAAHAGFSTLAEDIVSDVFCAVWRQADGFRAKSQVSTWLLAIARNTALSALRRRPETPLSDQMADAIIDPAEDAETIVANADRSMSRSKMPIAAFDRSPRGFKISSTTTKSRWMRLPRLSVRRPAR